MKRRLRMEAGMESPYQAEMRNEVTWGWWLLVLVGLLSIVAGVIILFKPGESLATLAVIAGIFLLLEGIFELVDSFMRSTANRGMVALIGILSAIIGVLLIRHPIGGVTVAALLIGIWLIAIGVIRFAAAFGEFEPRGWHPFGAVPELIAGTRPCRQRPSTLEVGQEIVGLIERKPVAH
jgi:uncharacterized membrane protein HdeD (DUF308 family)